MTNKARAKIYTEDIPAKERVYCLIDTCFFPYEKQPESLNIEYLIDRLKYAIFHNCYPRRPLADTSNLSIGEDEEGKYSFVLEFTCSNSMKMDNRDETYQNRIWFFESTTKMLETSRELFGYIPEVVKMLNNFQE